MSDMNQRCKCEARLTASGTCPFGCRPELEQPAWRRARLAARIRSSEAEENRNGYLSREESMRGALRADPGYRRRFFEQSVRARARSARKPHGRTG